MAVPAVPVVSEDAPGDGTGVDAHHATGYTKVPKEGFDWYLSCNDGNFFLNVAICFTAAFISNGRDQMQSGGLEQRLH